MPSERSSGAVNEPAAATTWSPASVVSRSVTRSRDAHAVDLRARLVEAQHVVLVEEGRAALRAQRSASFCVKTRASPDSSLGV